MVRAGKFAAIVGLSIFGLTNIAIAQDATGGDVEAGKIVFKKCGLCHVAVEGQNKIGPSLWNIVGRHSASIENFNYSEAMKNYNVVWDEATLFHYLEAPMKIVVGTKMTFVGLPKEEDRHNVIAYLKTLHN